MLVQIFRARTVYIIFGVWLIVMAAADAHLIPVSSDAFLNVTTAIFLGTVGFAIWQAVHYGPRLLSRLGRTTRIILFMVVFVAVMVAVVVVDRSELKEEQPALEARRALASKRLNYELRDDGASDLMLNGAVVWVEWLQRGEHGGSYLRALDDAAFGEDPSSYEIGGGTTFVFKAPDVPARVFTAARTFRFATGRKDLPAIAQAIQSQSRFVNEPVPPWTGEIAIDRGTVTEIKKDWSDGEYVEMDWALDAYMRVVKGRIVSAGDGSLGGIGSRYKIMAGTVFDIKVPHLSVQRHTAKRDIYIAKSGWPPIGDLQPFID